MPDPAAGRRSRDFWLPVALLLILPILVKAHLLLGWLLVDPVLSFAQLTTGRRPGLFDGNFTIDPNIAFTSLALGRRAALDVLSGQIPWWNPFEGVGTPLAGEMQSAALFPLTWLLLLQDGQLYLHLSLQMIAGTATLFLLRRLDCTVVAATAGAIAFEFNGTFAWLANAVVNPIPFLPLALLGVETLRGRILQGRGGGGACLAVALALSLYAGFPEVAFLDGLFVLAWTLVRTASLPAPMRTPMLLRIVFAGTAGLAIAAPLLVAFLGFLPHASLGQHTQEGFGTANLDARLMVATMVPYGLGGIFQEPAFAAFWGSVGGYAGCAAPVLAICALAGKSHRPLRIALAAWVLACWAITFGAPGIAALMQLAPGLGVLALGRYLPPSWEFCLCVLAAFALTDLAALRAHRVLPFAVIGTALACAAAAVMLAATGPVPHGKLALLGAVSAACVLATSSAAAWLLRGTARLAPAMAAVLAIEAIGYLWLPTLTHASAGRVEMAGVEFLRTNLGLNRFATLGPIQPNFGAYFGIAAINHNDLPIPQSWTGYVGRHLDDNAPPVLFTNLARIDEHGASAAENLTRHADAYAAIGVRYVVSAVDDLPTASLLARTPALHEAFRDRRVVIHEFAEPAAYFSAPGCVLAVQGRTRVLADCALSSRLQRLELLLPGWSATVAGHGVEILPTGEIFQAVDLPAGISEISFDYQPPAIFIGYLLFGLGWSMLCIEAVRNRTRVQIRRTMPAT
jgi:hypothetical protein